MANMGDPNASIPVSPSYAREMFGAHGKARTGTSVNFMSQVSVEKGISKNLGLERRSVAVKNTRKLGKKDLPLNDYLPKMEVNPETYEVRADGKLLTCEPAEVLPMAQRYFMF